MKREELYHGMKVTCEIYGVKMDAIVNTEERKPDFFLCQDVKEGCDCKQKFGKKYSWLVYECELESNPYKIKSKQRGIEDGLREGDVIFNIHGRCKVLGVCGLAILISLINKFDRGSGGVFTLNELIDEGYKLEQPKPSLPKRTLEQIKKELGYDFEYVE